MPGKPRRRFCGIPRGMRRPRGRRYRSAHDRRHLPQKENAAKTSPWVLWYSPVAVADLEVVATGRRTIADTCRKKKMPRKPRRGFCGIPRGSRRPRGRRYRSAHDRRHLPQKENAAKTPPWVLWYSPVAVADLEVGATGSTNCFCVRCPVSCGCPGSLI